MNISVFPRHVPDLDELLANIEEFDVADDSEIDCTKSLALDALKQDPHTELSDDAWLAELSDLFVDTDLVLPSTVNSTGGIVPENSSTDEKRARKKVSGAGLGARTKKLSRPRVSRKEELEYLRTKVKKMEDTLAQLKENSDCASLSDAEATSIHDKLHQEQSIALWKTLAERQKNQRDLVEIENAKLRQKLKTQVRMAKSLQRILCKRERESEELPSASSKRLRQQLPADSDANPFAELLQRLDTLYIETEERIARSCVASASDPVIRTRDVTYTGLDGMFLEFRNSKLVPFDIGTTSRATWRFLTEPGIKFNNYVEEHVEVGGDTMQRKFGVEIEHAMLYARQVARRFTEENRVVIVWHLVVDALQIAGTPSETLTFCESGWIVMQTSTTASNKSPVTLQRSYSMMTPNIDIDSDSYGKTGALTNFVLQSREDVEVGNDTIIENLLLEEISKQLTES